MPTVLSEPARNRVCHLSRINTTINSWYHQISSAQFYLSLDSVDPVIQLLSPHICVFTNSFIDSARMLMEVNELCDPNPLLCWFQVLLSCLPSIRASPCFQAALKSQLRTRAPSGGPFIRWVMSRCSSFCPCCAWRTSTSQSGWKLGARKQRSVLNTRSHFSYTSRPQIW